MAHDEKYIGMVLDGPFPPDVRVEKEIVALTKRGFKIKLLAAAPKKGRSFEMEGLDVTYVDLGNINPFWKALATLLDKVLHVDYSWLKYIKGFIKNNNLACLHVHDLILAGTVSHANKKFKLPLVVDFHENMPAALKVWREGRKGLKNSFLRLFEDYSQWSRYEKRICDSSDKIITVVDEMKQLLVDKHSLDPNKILVVGNTEQETFWSQAEYHQETIDRVSRYKSIVYTGGLGPHRGIHTTIEAISLIKKSEPNIHLFIVGSGAPDYEKHLHDLVKKFGVEKNVSFEGFQPFTLLPSYLKGASIGIIPHVRNEHTDNTIPHKLFQYILAEIPVLTSDCAPLKRILTELNGGRCFISGNAQDLAKVTLEMLEPTFSFSPCKDLKDFTWERDGEKLADFYEDFFAHKASK